MPTYQYFIGISRRFYHDEVSNFIATLLCGEGRWIGAKIFTLEIF